MSAIIPTTPIDSCHRPAVESSAAQGGSLLRTQTREACGGHRHGQNLHPDALIVAIAPHYIKLKPSYLYCTWSRVYTSPLSLPCCTSLKGTNFALKPSDLSPRPANWREKCRQSSWAVLAAAAGQVAAAWDAALVLLPIYIMHALVMS